MSSTDRAFRVAIWTNDLNIRTGSRTDYDKTGKYNGTGIFTIVREMDGWRKLAIVPSSYIATSSIASI